jgi:hypothetical protein
MIMYTLAAGHARRTPPSSLRVTGLTGRAGQAIAASPRWTAVSPKCRRTGRAAASPFALSAVPGFSFPKRYFHAEYAPIAGAFCGLEGVVDRHEIGAEDLVRRVLHRARDAGGVHDGVVPRDEAAA